jgi:hypothetical protein
MALPPKKWIKFQLTEDEWKLARKASINAGERWFLRWIRRVVVRAAVKESCDLQKQK